MDGWMGGRRRYIVFICICGEEGNIKEETVND
jgi:hypothetical protein